MSLIEAIDLCQRFDGRYVLENVSLKVDKGGVFALIGPTGAGKTTLLRLIGLIDLPASGKIYFDGVDTVRSARVRLDIRRQIAFVFQKPIVFAGSVYDNIACGLKWRGVERNGIHRSVSHVLEMVDLTSYQDRNARTLSGGEVQRVALARAVAVEPRVLLLDEPTANLDPASVLKIEELIRRIVREYDTTIIMTTHDMSQGQRLADKLGVLMNGEILQTGNSRDVFGTPVSREVATFVGAENIIDGVIVSSEDGIASVDVGGRVIEVLSDYQVGERVAACVRPEDITLAVAKVSSSARNSFAGKVVRVVTTGPLSRVEVDCGFPLVVLVTKRSAEELGLETGKEVYAAFKATGVHVIRREGS